MKELIPLIKETAAEFNIEAAAIACFIETETGGVGFNVDGKIIIQFEPVWFRKQAPYAPSGLWSVNKVEVQSKEWLAFNSAFAISPVTAMMSTSIGLGQILGLHYKRLGYATVGDMWDDAKKGLDRQVWQMCKFIATDVKLQSCLKSHDWDGVATIYNGASYKKMAVVWNRVPYDKTMAIAYAKYKGI